MTEDKKKYLGTVPPEDIIHLLGPIGESSISRPIWWTLDEKARKNIVDRIREALNHILSFNDERILAIHGALLVENAIDSHLKDITPNYKLLTEHTNYTFSMKITLCKALSLCPLKIYSCADLIRKTRNDFAHNLNIKSFEDVPKRIQAARNIIKDILPSFPENSSYRKLFIELITQTTIAIEIYRPSIQVLNKLIHTDEKILEDIMKNLNHAQN